MEGEGFPLHSLSRSDSDVLGCVERRKGRDKIVKAGKGYKVHRDLIHIDIQGAFKSGSTACICRRGTVKGREEREREEGGRERGRRREREREGSPGGGGGGGNFKGRERV
jgi:hypothetical protein